MVFHNEPSMMNVGVIGHAAFGAWMREALSKRFDTILHEPVPSVLLAILDGGTKGEDGLMPAQDKPGHFES